MKVERCFARNFRTPLSPEDLESADQLQVVLLEAGVAGRADQPVPELFADAWAVQLREAEGVAVTRQELLE